MTGTVKYFDESTGHGIIIDDITKEEYDVYTYGLVDKIKKGDKVEFDLQQGENETKATNVDMIGDYVKMQGAPDLSLYFDLEEFSNMEISAIISNLSELYRAIGGDVLIIKGMEQLEAQEFQSPQLIL